MRSSLHLLVAALPLAASLNLATPARPAASAGRCSNIRAIALDAPPDQLPTLSDAIPDCPRTVWDADELDIEYWQKKYKEEDLPLCPIEVIATPEANKQGVAYFVERRDELKAMLEKHGTIWFREFDLMKDEEGFRRMWEALDMDPCLDPLHSSGLRKFLAKRDAVYEEVNKQSLSKHYIGLHNESTNKKAAMDKATELVDKTIIPKFDMDFELIWGTDGNDMRLQAIEEVQSPVNRHPDTGRPAWFCNMHNQARFLRDRRPCAVPEVGMTDIYFGDLSLIPGEMLSHVNEVCEKTIVRVPMQAGDVLLCDNYRVLHGRDIFSGERLHAVSWS